MVTIAVVDSPKQNAMANSPRIVDCNEPQIDPQTDFDNFVKQNAANVDPFGIVTEELSDKVLLGPSQVRMYPTICEIDPVMCMESFGRNGLHCYQTPECGTRTAFAQVPACKVPTCKMNDKQTYDGIRCVPREGDHAMPGAGSHRSQTETPLEELRPCDAFCCAIDSCYLQFPQCIGCSSTYMCLFCMGEGACCKALDCSDEDSKCCALCVDKQYLKIPQNCCYFQCQQCCLDRRGEFPCGQKIPCIYTAFFLTVCADYQVKCMCCKQIKELAPRFDPAHKGGQ